MNNLMVIDGIEVRRDVHGRYCLNDLHRAAGGEQKYRPKYWLDNKQTRELIEQLFTEGGIPSSEQNQSVSFFQGGRDTQNLGIAPVNTVRGGAEQGTYVCKELVFAYAMWISPSFHLKVIRTFDRITSAPQTSSGMAADKMQAGVILLGFMRKSLTCPIHRYWARVRNSRRQWDYLTWRHNMPLMLRRARWMVQAARRWH
ncbi:KilA-N domain-containing protein [Salmonella enterica subsp. enterica serovar Typhimurium str. DT104]|uniref:KilA-N domain-containing protein n=1 Tax=Salmonella enterica TaxID=28901 RepID=UPI0005DD09E8|nr:KilA-N domain-containing protein [Salmonella enterica subsp. enterica serovar Typhimurium str. DT104]